MMTFSAGAVSIGSPTEREYQHVAAASRWLCNLEGKTAPPRTKVYKAVQQIARGGGCILVARMALSSGNPLYCGCITAVFPAPGHALAGDLVTEPFAPRKTALHLMAAMAAECRARGVIRLHLTAGSEKNRNRATYARLGFKPAGLSPGGAAVMTAEIDDVESGLRKRLKG